MHWTNTVYFCMLVSCGIQDIMRATFLLLFSFSLVVRSFRVKIGIILCSLGFFLPITCSNILCCFLLLLSLKWGLEEGLQMGFFEVDTFSSNHLYNSNIKKESIVSKSILSFYEKKVKKLKLKLITLFT